MMIYVPTPFDADLRINDAKYDRVSCGNCVWWKPDADFPPEMDARKDARGRCTLNPPGVGAYGNAPRPIVHADDHCSHHPLVQSALTYVSGPARFLREPLPANAKQVRLGGDDPRAAHCGDDCHCQDDDGDDGDQDSIRR